MACTETTLVRCPDCNSEDIKRNGKSKTYQQRYLCKSCRRSFQTTYHYRAWRPELRALVVPMTMRNSGIRDIEAVLGIHRDSVMARIKDQAERIPDKPEPDIKQWVNVAEIDEFWSFVYSKERQRWTWYAWDADAKCILAHHNGRRTNASCKALYSDLSTHYTIRRYNTDDWKAYSKILPKSRHRISKKGTQRIERQNLNFRTHIKRLNRRTICFSKSEIMHDAVIKLYIYRTNAQQQQL